MAKVWVTSDTHFGHHNIIKYCNRPFADVEQMNRIMVERWNALVSDNDTVIHVGDFAMGPVEFFSSYFNQLNGKKYLIRGNHDKPVTLRLGWEGVFDDFRMETPFGDVYFSHHPISAPVLKEDLVASGVVLLIHGHKHNTEQNAVKGFSVDVGVDAWGYQPVRLRTILEKYRVNKEST